MKITFQTILLSAALLVGGLLTAPLVITGCAGPQRNTHTALHAIGQAVDTAEREYMSGVLTGRYRTNGFPETQIAYSLFQIAYANAIWIASRDTNAIGVPPEVRTNAFNVTESITQAKGIK